MSHRTVYSHLAGAPAAVSVATAKDYYEQGLKAKEKNLPLALVYFVEACKLAPDDALANLECARIYKSRLESPDDLSIPVRDAMIPQIIKHYEAVGVKHPVYGKEVEKFLLRHYAASILGDMLHDELARELAELKTTPVPAVSQKPRQPLPDHLTRDYVPPPLSHRYSYPK